MNFWLSVIIGLYPPEWRERYGDEFRAMLELCDLSLADWLDMSFSALEARSGYHRMKHMHDIINRIAGLGLLFSTLALGLIIFLQQQNIMDAIIAIAPIVSIIILWALYRVTSAYYPTMSKVISGIGASGMILMMIGTIILAQGVDPDSSFYFLPAMGMFVLLGIWLFGINYMTLKTQAIPNWIGIIGITISITWFSFLLMILLQAMTPQNLWEDYGAIGFALGILQGIFIIGTPLGYIIWSLSLGWYFTSGTVSRKTKLA